MLLPSVFDDSHDLFGKDLSSCTFLRCRFCGNSTELVLAGTQWFAVNDLMMDVLARFSFRR